MQGNSSSSGITWRVGDSPLRFIFFDGPEGRAGLAEIQARELRLSLRSLERLL